MSSKEAWSCQELVNHADNWSLAGNVGLLRHMEQFAENLFQQAEETNNNLDDLLKELDSTEIQLDLVKNQFLGLQNTQFIESRVYEDDETVEGVAEVQPEVEVKLDEARKRELLKGAVVDGLKVLDKYYERVSIPESDSEGEDETDCSNFVLREKDPYINRPLPYVIGTEEWHTKWHAGLAESSDDDEEGNEENGKSGNIEDEFSDTDSETNLPVADRRSQLLDQEYSNSNTADNSDNTANDNEDEMNGNSVSASTPIAPPTFAEQLAAKLGDVLSVPARPTDPEVNTRPIQKRTTNAANVGNLLPEQPPDIPETFPGTTGLFSGGGGLFDDADYTKPPPILPSSGNATTKKVRNLFDEDEDDEDFPTHKVPPVTQISPEKDIPKKTVRGLFDDEDEDEDQEDIFTQPSQFLTKKETTGFGFIPTEPPILPDKEDAKRKPIGGVNVLGFIPPRRESSLSLSDSTDNKDKDLVGDINIGKKIENERRDNKYLIRQTPIEDIISDEDPDKTQGVNPSEKKDMKENKKVLSLFDDTDDLFEDDDDLFTPVSLDKPKLKKNSLFEDDMSVKPPPISKIDDDIFDGNVTSIPKLVSSSEETTSYREDLKKNKSLFDDDDEDTLEPPPLFETPSSQIIEKPKKTRNLFDESSEDDEDDMFANIVIPKPKIKSEDVSKIAEITKNDIKNIEKEDIFEAPNKNIKKNIEDQQNSSSMENIEEDIFSSALSSDKRKSLEGNKVKETIDQPKQDKPKLSLFDDKPPPLLADSEDDDWETPKIPVGQKQQISEKYDRSDSNSERSLSSKESSPEKKLPGKLKLPALNINVNALIPGARLPPKLQNVDKHNIDNDSDAEDAENGENAGVSRDDQNNEEFNVGDNKSLSKDGDDVSVDVLTSFTKTRAKIPIKRRPSTRQGRKAALQSLQQAHPKTTEATPDTAAISPPDTSAPVTPIPTTPPAIPDTTTISPPDITAPVTPIPTHFSSNPDTTSISPPVIAAPVTSIPTQFSSTPDTTNTDLPSYTAVGPVAPVTPICTQLSSTPDTTDDKTQPKNQKSLDNSLLSTGVTKHKENTNISTIEHLSEAKLSKNQNTSKNDIFDSNKPPPLEQSEDPRKDIDIFDDIKPSISLFDDDDIDIFASLAKPAEKQSTNKQKKADTLSTPKKLIVEDDVDLFLDKVQVKSTVSQPKPKTLSLFGEDDDDDDGDLFASMKPSKSITKKSKTVSLFGDDDDADDDDIFSTKNIRKQSQSTKMNKNPPKTSISNVKVTTTAKSDPLADLFGDSD